MKVPEDTRNIALETPTTQPTTMPRISMPGVARDAFGENVGKAYEGLGEGLKILANHMDQMAIDEWDKEEQKKEIAYAQDWQNILTNQETETVPINGQDVARPKGLLLRQLGQAKGVIFEANEIDKKLCEQYLKGVNKYQYGKLVPFLKGHFSSIKDKLVTHEQNQLAEDYKNITESNLKIKTLEASTIRDGKELGVAIDSAISSAARYNSQFDPATQKVKNQEIASKIAKSTFDSAIINSIDLSQTKVFLEEIKDKIPQATYDEINQDIEKTQKQNAEKIKRIQAENVQLAKLAVDKAEDDLVVKKINSQLSVGDVKVALSAGTIRPKFADSLIKALISFKTVDAKTDPVTYSDMVDLILSPNRKVSEVREKLLDAYNEGSLSETDFKHLYTTKMIPSQAGRGFSVAEEYSDEMAKANEPPRLGFIRTAVNMLKAFGQTANAINPLTITVPLIKQLFNRIDAGKTPDNEIQDVAKELVKERIKSDNPVVGFLDDVPNAIATKGAIKHAYPGSTKLKTESTYKGELDTQGQYEIGDTVTHDGKEYIVVDFDTDGEPLLEEAENAR